MTDTVTIPALQRWAIARAERDRAKDALCRAERTMEVERIGAVAALQGAGIPPREVLRVGLLGGSELGVYHADGRLVVAWEGRSPQ